MKFGARLPLQNGKECFGADNCCTYPYGMDPKWYITTNELQFFNSYKMKLSVIVGVSQMIVGVFLKAINCIHFNHWMDFICEFIPQIIFMFLIFGWMLA